MKYKLNAHYTIDSLSKICFQMKYLNTSYGYNILFISQNLLQFWTQNFLKLKNNSPKKKDALNEQVFDELWIVWTNEIWDEMLILFWAPGCQTQLICLLEEWRFIMQTHVFCV